MVALLIYTLYDIQLNTKAGSYGCKNWWLVCVFVLWQGFSERVFKWYVDAGIGVAFFT